MRVLAPTTEDEVLLRFVGVERLYPRWSGRLGSQLSQKESEHLRYSSASEWTPEDRAAGLRSVKALYGPLLQRLLSLEVRWHTGSSDADEIASFRLPNLPNLAAIAPALDVRSFARELDHGRDTADGELSGDYRYLKRRIDHGPLRATPCVVAESDRGPYTILSGLLPLCVVTTAHSEGAWAPGPIAVDVGLTSRLTDWGFEAPRADPPTDPRDPQNSPHLEAGAGGRPYDD